MSKRAIIYARVSTDEQAETGYGLPFQIGQCEAYAGRKDYSLVETITDDYSGKTVFRPGIHRLLELITPHRIDVVIIHRTDRLGRRGHVQETLENEITARGAAVEYVTMSYDLSTPQGRAMRRVQGVFDQLDYESLIDKFREHKIEAVQRGSIITARPPYGYQKVPLRNDRGKRVGTRLEIVEAEAEIVRQVYQWYVGDGISDPLSIRAIAQRLTAQRIPTRGDAPNGNRTKTAPGVWGESVVHKLLASEVYTGVWHYGKTKMEPRAGNDQNLQVRAPREGWIAVEVPAIVSRELFDAARERSQRNAANAQRNRKNDYLFSGMLTCGLCNHTYTGWHTYATQTGGTARYRCNGKRHNLVDPCTMPAFSEPTIDAAVWAWIKRIVRNPEQVAATLHERQRINDEQNAQVRSLIATTDRRIAAKKIEQSNLIRLFSKNPIPALEVEIDRLQREIDGHEAERVTYESRLIQAAYSPGYLADVQTACARIAAGLDHFNATEKRRTYVLLDLRLRLAIEDGQKVAYAECILDADRLLLTRPSGAGGNHGRGDHGTGSGGESGIVSASSTKMKHPIVPRGPAGSLVVSVA